MRQLAISSTTEVRNWQSLAVRTVELARAPARVLITSYPKGG
jgi:hypothetical protein